MPEKRLPANFNDWDTPGVKPPSRLPANFNEWDAPKSTKQDTSSPMSMAIEAGKGLVWDTLAGAGQLLGGLVSRPIETVGNAAAGIFQGHANEAAQMVEAARQGDIVSTIGHGLYAAMPVVGPIMSQGMAVVTDPNKTGDERARAAGQVVANALPLIPRGSKAVRPAQVAVKAKTTPQTQQLAQFAAEREIPLDAATVSENRFIKGVQQVSGSTWGGSTIATKARGKQTEAMRRVAGELMDETGAPATTPEVAGRKLAQSVEMKAAERGDVAHMAYAELAEIERLPEVFRTVNNQGSLVPMAIPVDVRPMKAWAEPILRDLENEWKPVDPKKAQAFNQQIVSLRSILDGDDFKRASIAEKDLSNLKALVRNAPEPTEATMRAADGMMLLQSSIDDAVGKIGGPAGLKALQKGRANWAKAAEIEEVVKKFREEPVQAFAQTVWKNDTGIDFLRRVNSVAPEQLPEVGRAFLEDMFTKNMDGGGFAKAGTMYNAWKSLGPETKKLLYPNGQHRMALDNFFQLADRMARMPNTSGTAAAAAAQQSLNMVSTAFLTQWDFASALATQVGAAAAAKALYSPKIVQAMVNGQKIPIGSPARALALMKIVEMAKQQNEGVQ